MLILIFKITGCYILPYLKDFVFEISKLRRMYTLPSNIRLLNHQSQASIVLKRFLMPYEHMQKCVHMFLIQCKIRRSTDSVDLLSAMYVSAMNPICMQINLLYHISSICVHTHSSKCDIHMPVHPFSFIK